MDPLLMVCPICGQSLGGFIASGHDRALAGPFCPILEVARWMIAS